MKFEINTRLDWCSIFGSEMDSPLDCQLAISGDYYLIYIDMTAELAGKGSIDIFALLNRTFSTALPENTLFVEDAGFYSFATNNDAPTPLTLKDVFPATRIPFSVTTESTSEPGSTSFWLRFRLEKKIIFGSLLEIGINDSQHPAVNELALSGHLNNTLPAKQALMQGTYIARLPNFKLFNTFDFLNLTLIYHFEQSAIYEIKGDIAFALFKRPYTFNGQVRYTDRLLQACLVSSDPKSTVPTLFGEKMPGVSFANLIFGLYYTLESEDNTVSPRRLFRVQGTVNYGPSDRPDNPVFSGQIYLNQLKPVLAALSIDRDISIGAIFNQSIPGSHWPESFINIVFYQGSALYYQDESSGQGIEEVDFYCPLNGLPTMAAATGIVYQPGFNIYARFDITIIKTIKLIGDVNIRSEGVTANIQLVEPITLFILQITAPSHSQQPGAGPIFSFSSADATMCFQCGLQFFQEDFGVDVKIAGSKGESGTLSLSGELASNKAYPPMFPKAPTLRFSYSKAKGFTVDNWPDFPVVTESVDLIKGLKTFSASKGGGCGELGHLATDKLIQTAFTLSPGFSSDTQLSLVLNGRYEISIAGTPIGTVTFPKVISIGIPDDVAMAQLGDIILQALVDAAESLAEGLAQNSKAIAVFLAVTAGKAAANYAMTLACQGVVDAVTAAAAEAAVDALAAGAGIFAAVTAAAAVVDRSCFIAGTRVRLATGELCCIEDVRVGMQLLGLNGAVNTVTGFDRPRLGQRQLYAFNDTGNYFITAEHPVMTRRGWCSIDPQATQKENANLPVKTLQPGDEVVCYALPDVRIDHIFNKHAECDTQLYNVILDGDHTYYAEDYLVHNKDPKPPPVKNPDPPDNLSVMVNDADVLLRWASANYASGYRVSLNAPDGTVLLDKTVDLFTVTQSVPLTVFTMAGDYLWHVASTRGSFTSAASTCVQHRLTTPHVQSALIDSLSRQPAVQLYWDAIEGATHYRILNEQGNELLPPVPPGDVRYTVSSENMLAGTYSFAVQAIGTLPTLASALSVPQIWTRLASPANVQAHYAEGIITANWTPLPGVTRYLLSLYDPTGVLVAQSESASIDGGATLPLRLPLALGNYQLYLCSMPAQTDTTPVLPGVWVSAPTLDIQLSAEQWAVLAFKQQMTAVDCAGQLLNLFPGLTPKAIAIAMAVAGYQDEDTAKGLKAAYPNITATELTAAILAAYGKAPTLAEIASAAFVAHESGSLCAQQLLSAYPSTPALELGQTMATAGYLIEATAQGLKEGYPTLTASQLTMLLLTVYGTPLTLEACAAQAYQQHQDGKACGLALIDRFPDAQKSQIGGAMQLAGYPVEETGAGLRAAFPTISATELTSLLITLYGNHE